MAYAEAFNRVVAALAAQGRHLNRMGRTSCPAHDGDDDNLSVRQGDRGVLFQCFSHGCSANDIAASLGLRIEELFDDFGERLSGGAVRAPVAPPQAPVAIARVRPEDAPPMRGANERFAAIYDYCDSNGYLLFRQTRAAIPLPGKKGILPFHLDAGLMWQSGCPDGIERVPYRLPEVLDAVRAGSSVWFLEGEKDVDNAWKLLGVAATTLAFGAKRTVDPAFAKYFVGADVVLCGDNDDFGRAFMQAVGNALQGHARSVRLLELPNLPEKGDISDWIEAGGTRAHLDELLANAPAFVPDVREIGAEEMRGPRVNSVCLADVRAEPVTWLWPGYVPWGKLTIIEGDPGLGKSTLSLAIAACVSRGGGGLPGVALSEPADVLFIPSHEDGLADTVVPRLLAAGADLRRVRSLQSVVRDEKAGVPLTIPDDIAVLKAEVVSRGARLVLVDALTTTLNGRIDAYKDSQVRQALAPLAQMAEETGAAVVLIRHMTKAARGGAIMAGGGSIAITGVVRVALQVHKSPDDENRRVVAIAKCNVGKRAPSLQFSLVDVGNCARIVWEGESPHSADELNALRAPDEGNRAATEEATDWLRVTLTRGPLTKKEVLDLAVQAGHAKRTVERAADKIGVVRERIGVGGIGRWSLPGVDGSAIPAPALTLERGADAPTLPGCANRANTQHLGATGGFGATGTLGDLKWGGDQYVEREL